MPYFRRQLAFQLIEMVVPFRQHNRGTPVSNRLHDLPAYQPRAAFVTDEFVRMFAKLGAQVRIRRAQRAKTGRPDKPGVFERPSGRLVPGVDVMAERAALHEDDGMVPVFTGHGCR